MNNEIKEILDYIDDRIIPNEKWNKIKDYITNLQKENKKLSKEIKKNKKEDVEIRNKNCFLVNGFHELEERIDKAIAYIKSHKNDYEPYELNDYNIRELLDILQGSDK